MICKWVTCVPDPGPFGAAQSRWSVIVEEPGLVGQVGGWDDTTGEACILGVWDGRSSYDRFMRTRHDAVVEEAGQAGTYRSLTTAVGPVVFAMSGDAGSLRAAIRGGGLLRVADCTVRPERVEHFVAVQRDVWAPGMAAAGGMLAGLFSRLGPDRYLATTWWSGAAAHGRYAREDVGPLRRRAAADADISAVAGHVIQLEPAWRVVTDR